MSGFVPEYIEKPVPYCALVPNTKYRIQYHNVTAPGSGKAIGTFEKLMIDFDLTDADAEDEDADLEPMDTIGYAIFNHVHRVPGAKLPMGMDGSHRHGQTYAFLVFSQGGNDENMVTNEEVSFYAYTLPEHQSRMLHNVLATHTKEDIAKSYKKGKSMFGGKQSRRQRKQNVTKKVRVVAPKPKRKRRSYANRRRSGRNIAGPGFQDQLSPSDQVIVRRYRPTPYYPRQPNVPPSYDLRQMDNIPATPMQVGPRQGALTWGDAAKLAAANIAAVAVGEGMHEAFED